jgi:hypothetical protein
MPDAVSEASLGMASREVYRFRHGDLLPVFRAALEIKGFGGSS